MNFIRKRLVGSPKTYNSSDPLHAYPNQFDLIVHSLFQRLSRFEVNNADNVRAALRLFRVGGIVSTLASIVGLVVSLAVGLPAGAIALGRRQDKPDEEPDRIDWSFVDHAAQSIIHAIQNGQLRYEL